MMTLRADRQLTRVTPLADTVTLVAAASFTTTEIRFLATYYTVEPRSAREPASSGIGVAGWND